MTDLKGIVLKDLHRGMRLMIRAQDDIDPQFRFATSSGDVALAVTLTDDMVERRAMFGRIRRFAAWQQALAYTMTCNIAEPVALMTVGAGGKDVVGALLKVSGEKGGFTETSFSGPFWIARDAVDYELLSLLPGRTSELSLRDLLEIDAWFGVDGHFPAVQLQGGGK